MGGLDEFRLCVRPVRILLLREECVANPCMIVSSYVDGVLHLHAGQAVTLLRNLQRWLDVVNLNYTCHLFAYIVQIFTIQKLPTWIESQKCF